MSGFDRPLSIEELQPRQRIILRAVIFEYVAAAEPVSSEQIVQKYELGVKSATIRNELSELLSMGLLEQPHTSAGRVPSDLGYRYYVDYLLSGDKAELESAEKGDVKAPSGEVLQELLRETARLLSRQTHLLGIGLSYQNSSVTVRNIVVSALGPTQAMLVVIFTNGHVENKLLECPANLTLDDVGRVNEELQASVVGKSYSALSKIKLKDTENPQITKLLGTIQTALRTVGKQLSKAKVVVEGEEFILAQPEFRTGRDEDWHTLLEVIHDPELLFDAITGSTETTGHVTIGRENRDDRLKKLSVVRRSFTVGGQEAGIIAVVGPTRMRYPVSVGLVDYTALALSDALTRHFA